MQISQAGLKFIADMEGLRSHAYQDAAGVWTIGFGHTGDVKPEDHIGWDTAFEFLKKDVLEAEHCVHKSVLYPLKQNQLDALVSLVFNIGCHNFMSSTLLRKLNKGTRKASEHFLDWVKVSKNGKSIRMSGLINRRKLEKAMYDGN